MTQGIQYKGDFFEAVQSARLFADSKSFVDSLPKADPAVILDAYHDQKDASDFDLKAFVERYFELPPEITTAASSRKRKPMEDHLRDLWPVLTREADKNTSENSSLIPLPKPYIVPGGRFREIYYWDSYFTAEGLLASGHTELARNMVENFIYLINTVGHIPNGNRWYFSSRSQPPFLVCMIDLLFRYTDSKIPSAYLDALIKEWEFWMEGMEPSEESPLPKKRVVPLPGNMILNRYWDERPKPRQESWHEDVTICREVDPAVPEYLFRNIRAACESGWDFSSRWFSDAQNLSSIKTTEIIPVDLNSLLYNLELRLSRWLQDAGRFDEAYQFEKRAQRRKSAILHFCWNSDEGSFFDYDAKKRTLTSVWSLASVYPLFFQIADSDQARSVAKHLEDKFLKPGGLVTTLNETGQQWDYPNGWAPLQWLAYKGLQNYGYNRLAREIRTRWLNLVDKVYNQTGKMMEKYNVVDTNLEAGGGEYPGQDGFGWTNGVTLAMLDEARSE